MPYFNAGASPLLARHRGLRSLLRLSLLRLSLLRHSLLRLSLLRLSLLRLSLLRARANRALRRTCIMLGRYYACNAYHIW